jgi:ubiquinol-cytochrome c reductase cytochrome b subunit
VITSIIDWLDHRTGMRKIMSVMLLEGVPGGAKWRYVWGSCLAFVFSIQLITGLLLMTAYSPSSSQAWSSVHFIQYKMDFGWLIRGLHHFGSQTMMVLIGLHMLQVVIAGAHLPPREVNWWLGIGLLSLTLGLSLTGYLLPWDQKGYWATRVATNIASNIPVLGDDIKQLAVGGPDYGNHTLTRFYALHVGILPLGMIVLIVAHLFIFRRHGVTSAANTEGLVTQPENEDGAESFWPRQAFYDMLACVVVFSIMLGLVCYGFGHSIDKPEGVEDPGVLEYNHWAKAGERGKGADLDAPADRDTPDYPARPEWYFLFLFQLLKYFPGDQILIGTVFIPNGVMLLLALLPIFGYGRMRIFGYCFSVFFVVTLFVAVGLLTLFAIDDDTLGGLFGGKVQAMRDATWDLVEHPDEATKAKATKARFEHAEHHEKSVKAAEVLAKRASNIAMAGTPVEGGHVLMRTDPKTAGRKAFEIKCGSCHSFSAQMPFAEGDRRNDFFDSWLPKDKDGKPTATASDLGDFGSEAWVRSLLKNPLDDKHFGRIKIVETDDKGKAVKGEDGKDNIVHAFTRMAGWRKGIDKARTRAKKPVDAEEQEKEFDDIAKWLAYQSKPRDQRTDNTLIKRGEDAFFKETNKCFDCHSVEKRVEANGKVTWDPQGGDLGPDLTNYGSAAWIRSMIMSPGHRSRYGKENLMPAFRNTDGPGAEILMLDFPENERNAPGKTIEMSDIEREMIIRWMLRDYRPVFGGATIAK